jgi:hypothetical protein
MDGRSNPTGGMAPALVWVLGCLGLLFCVFGDPVASAPTVALGMTHVRQSIRSR